MPDRPTHAGLLLAGGASSRFGASKADAELAGRTLGEIALQRLASSCERTAVAGRIDRPPFQTEQLTDPVGLARGPLAGILAGLEWARAGGFHRLSVSPCDMPLLPRTIHHDLLKAALAAKAPIALATTNAGHNPLCSIWSTDLAPIIRERMAFEHPSIWRLAMELGAIAYPLDHEDMALNVNTPADLDRAATLIEYHWWSGSA